MEAESTINPGRWEVLNNTAKGYGLTQWTLVSASLYGSTGAANTSHEIDTIKIVDNEIFATPKQHTVMDIYAMNSDGFGHLFLNVVVVSREDIPDGIKNVFPAR